MKMLLNFSLSLFLLLGGCSKEQPKNEENGSVKTTETQPAKAITNFGTSCYRTIIPAYNLNGKSNIPVKASVLYARFDGPSVLIIQSQLGSSFMGVGTIKFESGANDNEGSIIVNPKSAKGEDGGEYKFKYKKLSDGKFGKCKAECVNGINPMYHAVKRSGTE